MVLISRDGVERFRGQTLLGTNITGGHNKYDQILCVKIGKYVDFCVYRRSYLLWSPVI